jgi:FkbM family methyltransferase
MGSRDAVEDLIFDVGLHKGEDAAFYIAMGYRVVGFEADPELAAHCRTRFRDELAAGRFTLVEGAITTTAGDSVTFYRHPGVPPWGTIDRRWRERNKELGASSVALEVAAVDFARWLADAGTPHYMKVDIEGSDRACFDALRESGSRPDYVSLESAKEDFDELIGEFDLLEDLGYRRFAVVQQAGIGSRPVPVTRRDGTHVEYGFEPHSSGPFGQDVGPWTDRDDALAEYRRIYRRYRHLGDRSLVQRNGATRRLRDAASGLLGVPLPGWYDTHAARV